MYSKHHKRIHNLCWKMTHNDADAEDLLQETFLSAHKKRHQFEGRSALSSWIYRIAINECLMFLRGKRGISKPQEIPLFEMDFCLPEHGKGPSDAEILTLYELIAKLPENAKQVIEGQLYGLVAKEAAFLLGTTEATIKCRLHRARKYLRKGLMR